MPLIILTGYPCSGLTYRANQLAAALEETQTQLFSSDTPPKSKYKIHVVSTHDNVNHPRTVYDTARTEKEARGIAYTRAKRMLGKDSFVILDGMNYIKGYRYQLWCEAKAFGTTSCVVHVGTPIDQCVANNEARIERKNASNENKDESKNKSENQKSTSESSPETSASASNNEAGEASEASDPYPPDLLDNLIFRYEEPSMNSRWDKPLFTVPWPDAEPPIAEIWTALTGIPHPSTIPQEGQEEPSISPLTAALNSTSLSSAASTTTTRTPGAATTTAGGGRGGRGGRGTLSSRPRVAIKPHQATVLPATSDSSALYNMEKRTSAIVQAIRTFTLSNPSAKAALAASNQQQQQQRQHKQPDDAPERQEEGIRVPVPESSTPIFIPAHIVLGSVTDDLAAAGGVLTLPRLQRLRRQWITLNRAYIGAPHAAGKGGGGLKDEELGDAFVRFLNADFADEVGV